MDQSSLLFFHKIHSGTMSINKDKYLTPFQRTRSTRPPHNSRYCRPQTYSDVLNCSFFSKDYGIVCPRLSSQLRPLNSGQDYKEELCDKIRLLKTSNPRATLWINGDSNLPGLDWETHTIKGHNYPISINQCFLNTIYNTGSDQIVRFPTRGQNIRDVFLTNRPSLIEKCKAESGLSDHDIVFVKASTSAIPPETSNHNEKCSYGSMWT